MSLASPELQLPALPRPGEAAPFPWPSLLLPPIAAALLWLITSSPIMLVMALLGPLGAAGTALLQRRRRSRGWQASLLAFEQRMRRAADELEALHRLERSDRWQQQREQAREHWLLGEGTTPSRVRVDCPAEDGQVAIDGAGAASGAGKGWAAQLETARRLRQRLRERARAVDAVPVTAPRSAVLTVAGPAVLTEPVLRGILLQHWAAGPEAGLALLGDAPEWLRPLAGGRQQAQETLTLCFGAPAPPVPAPAVVLLAEPAAQHAPDAATLLRLAADGSAQLSAGGLSPQQLAPWLCSREAFRHAVALRSPQTATRAAPVALDLPLDGPHALVGGTTGSGKSEFLTAWLLAMAGSLPPERLSLLLIDFKGGCGFDRLAELPHSAGLVTDLDDDAAERVLRSIGAELRHRERQLRLQGVRRIEESSLPRLVVAIDEYAALRQQHPEASRVLADLAARGRSLGVHLILATQQPGGVVDQALLANFGLRILFRVHDAAESRALLGSAAAAQLPATEPGWAAVLRAGGVQQPQRFALAGDEAWAKARAWPRPESPRPVWREPLPARLGIEQCRELVREEEGTEPGQAAAEARGSAARKGVAWKDTGQHAGPGEEAVLLGARDLPDEQCWAPLSWLPGEGALTVLGGPASGKSGALALIAARHPRALRPGSIAALWDLLEQELAPGPRLGLGSDMAGDAGAAEDQPRRPEAILLDDLDRLLAEASVEYRPVIEQRLVELMQRARASGRIIAVTATKPAAIGFCAAQSGMQLLLAYRQRSEYLAAGGSAADFRPGLPPGAGHLHGERFQLASAQEQEAAARFKAVTAAPVGFAELLVVVPSAPRWSAQLRSLGWPVRSGSLLPDGSAEAEAEADTAQADAAGIAPSGCALVLLEAEQCQGRWPQWQALLRSQPVALLGLALGQYRSLASAGGELPPLLEGPEQGWLLHPEQPVRRIDFRKPAAGVGG